MADVQSNIGINLDTTQAMAQIRALQREISNFQVAMAKGSASTQADAARLGQNLSNRINKTGQFSAQMTTIKTTTESFTNALERNKLSMGQYFRYAGASTKTFGRLFSSEFSTIEKVARERVKTLQTQYVKMGRDASGAMKAMAVRPLALDMDNLATRTMIAAQKQQLFNQLLRQGSTNLLNFGKNTQWAGRQLMVGFTIPLAIFGTTAAREFMKLEEQAIKFKRVYGDMFTTSGETEKALDNIRELADEFTKYGIAVEKTIDLAAKVAQMGNMGDALEAQVRQATRLSVLGGIEQQEALDTTISLTNAFGTATEDLADNINFLNAAENQTILSIEDFNEAIPKAGSVVRQLGGDVGDLAFFLTAMREGGINASQGANALKSSLARLINPTEAAQERLAEMGINVMGIVEANAGNLRGTVLALAQQLDTLDPLTRARAIEQLFGKFQFARMSTMFSNIVKEGSQANKVLQLTGSTTQELGVLAERELGRVEDSVSYKFQQSLEKFQASLAPLGEAFLKAVTPLIDFGTKVLNKFNEMGDGAKTFVVATTAVLGLIGPVALMTFGLIANGVANLIKMFANMSLFYQRLTGQNKSLGVSTQYMTQEQLEASAVAASLNQSHSTLIQTFTTETAALNRLSAAYTKAVVAQKPFIGAASRLGYSKGAAAAPKGYASGVVSVPGRKGAGDVVPAMLSPGEAVIPAEQAEKYRGMIKAMIANQIPGFEAGIEKIAGGERLTADKDITTTKSSPKKISIEKDTIARYGKEQGQALLARADAEAAAMRKANAALPKNQQLSAKQLKEATRGHRAHIVQTFGGFKNWGSGAWTPQTQLLNTNVSQQLGKPGATQEYFKSTLAKMVANKEIPQKQADRLMANIRNNVATRTTTPALQKVLGAMGKDFASGKQAPKGVSRSFMRSAYLGAAGLQGRMAQEKTEKIKPGTKSTRIGDITDSQKKKAESRLKAGVAAVSRNPKNTETPVVKKSNKVRVRAAEGAAKAEAATAKKNEKTAKAAKDIQNKVTPKTLAVLGPDGVKKAIAEGKNPNRVAANVAAAARKRLEKSATPQTLQRLGQGGVKAAAAAGKNPNAVAAGMSSAEARAANKSAAAGAGNASSRSRMGLGGVAAMGSVAAMGASFAPGKIGDVAQQLIFPLMMLPTILPLLKNPIVAAIAAVAALGVGAYMLEKRLKDATKAGIESANAMSMTSEKLKGISEITGTVSATELRQRQQEEQLTAAGPEFTSFGKSFVEDSEQGQAMLEDIENQFNQGKNISQVGQNIGRQLATAISQGALSIEQARAIAGALGEQLGDYTISTKISGELTELLGVDGSDLLNDPLEVMVRIKESSMKEQAGAFEQAMSAIQPTVTPGGTARTVAGGGLVIAGGAMAATGFGAIPGAIVAAAGAVAMGTALWDQNEAMANNNKLSAAAMQLGVEQLSQNQLLVDSLNQQYDNLVAQAETEAEIASIERRRREDLDKLNAANAETTRQLIEQAKLFDDKNLYQEAIDASIDSLYKEGPMKVFADEAKEQLKDLENEDFKVSMEMMLASGELSPIAILEAIKLAAENPEFEVSFKTAVDEKGTAQVGQLMALLAQNDLTGKSSAVMFDFIANKEEPAFSEALDALAVISSAESRYPVEINLDVNGEEKVDAVAKDLKEYESLPETMTKEAFIDIAQGDERLEAVLEDWDALGFTENISRQFILDYIVNTHGDDSLVKRYFAETGKSASGKTETRQVYLPGSDTVTTTTTSGITDADRYDASMYFTAKNSQVTTDTNDPDPIDEDDDTTGSGSTPSSVLDNILKKLRDVRKSTVQVAKGWDAAKASLNNLFSGGETLEGFTGLEQMMRGLNLGESLISTIVGMDPDEFEKRKGELFTFDSMGNITGITDALRNMSLAMQSIAIGEFQNKQEKALRVNRDQLIAIDKLVRSGLSLADAYSAVEDTAFASAVAQEKNNGKIRDAARDAEKAAKAAKDFAAAQGLVSSVEDTGNTRRIAEWLASNRSSLTNAQVEAILKDTNLQRLILTPGIEPRAVNQALEDAANQADLDLQIKKLSIDGLTSIFDDGFSKAMEKFTAMEQQITLDFALTTADDEDIVKSANREIETIRYQLDDLEADLTRIQDEEDKVNGYYDDRIEALDEVADINERIAKQQKAQMNIADALSQGDIAAAARARLEYRQQQSSDALEQTKNRIEDAREASIAKIRLDNGKSRVELEEKILDLQKQIFDIEEERLEPAQRRLDLANQMMEDQIDSLEVLGRTREEWARIQNNIDIAKTSSESYTDSIQNAVDAVAEILEYWNELDGKEVTTYHQIVETRDSTSPPPSSGGGSSGGNGGGNNGQTQAERDATAKAKYNAEIARLNGMLEAARRARDSFKASLASPYVTGSLRQQYQNSYEGKKIEVGKIGQSINLVQSRGWQAYLRMGGMVPYKNLGGLMNAAIGGMFKSVNTDSIPAMLSAGEYVVKRSAVQKFGLDNLEKINSGTYSDGSVYNYNLAVNVKSDADPSKIARTVISQIKQVDAQRIRGNRI